MSDKSDSFGDVQGGGQEFSDNIAEVFTLSQQVWQKFLEGQSEDAEQDSDPLNAMPAMQELATALWSDPEKMLENTMQYWQAQGALWQHAVSKMSGGEAIDLPKLPRAGKQFKHEEWSENALFEYVKNSYLLMSGWVQDTVDGADLEQKDQKKAAFYTRNMIEALSPTNFAALNPEVLAATNAEKGENLVRGLKMMLADMERGKGKLLIRQTDMDAFEVGRNMAMTEGQVIWQNNILQLIQYAPLTEKVHAKPLLMIPPWINKYYVLDLNPKKSLMKWLVEQGYTVFIISWVNPDIAQKDETWGSYMQGVSDVIDVVLAETGQKQTHLASYCIGGTLTGTLLAKLGQAGDKRVASATFFTALMDFEDGGELQVMVDDKTIALVDAQMEEGFLPAQTMASAFNMLRSGDLIWSFVVNNYMLGKDPFPFDLLYWNADSTAMPAKVHHFYLKQFYTDNMFAKGGLVVDGQQITLADIKAPVYHVATKEDHIAPAGSVYFGAQEMTGADVRFVLAGSGHIAGVVNPPVAGKYQYWSNGDMSANTLDGWLSDASETEGSWWPDWDKWLKKRSGKKVFARKAGAINGMIEVAPGAFVKARFDAPSI